VKYCFDRGENNKKSKYISGTFGGIGVYVRKKKSEENQVVLEFNLHRLIITFVSDFIILRILKIGYK